MAHDRVQRRADLVGDLGHDLSGQRQALGVAQVALHREQELVDAGDHRVEPPGQRAELVRGVDVDGGALLALHCLDGPHEPADRPVHDPVHGEAHQRSHDQHRDGREDERQRAQAAFARIEATEGELGGDAAGHVALEGDGRHDVPVAALGVLHEPRHHLAAIDLVGVLRREGQPARRLAGGDHGAGVSEVEAKDVDLQHAPAHGHDLLDLALEHRPRNQLMLGADRRRQLPREEDRPLLEILLHPGPREVQLDQREAERHDHDDEQAEQDELLADAEIHGPVPM